MAHSEKYDSKFELSQERIIKEINDRINILRSMGIADYVINQMISRNRETPKLSKVLITEDYRILLPNYDNMEIKIPILPKALYIFFLNHPEGMLFKEIRNHRKELLNIYMTISPRKDLVKMEQSIDDIIDSSKNSINEKCSRIKSAFINKLTANLAHQYYISGNCGEPKRILLDRNLVINQSELKICKTNKQP
jgi:hypothetical protein